MKMNNSTLSFASEAGFCSECGSVLPNLTERGSVTCLICKHVYGPEAFGNLETTYTLYFNSAEEFDELNKKGKTIGAEGPVVDRACSRCGHDKMSYATIQLRSADEGQTVFYTCLKCKYKESENS